MKTVYYLFLLVSSIYTVQGQSIVKNTVRLGIGTSAPQVGGGTGLQGGFAVSNEYLRELKKYLFVGASVHYLTRHEGAKNESFSDVILMLSSSSLIEKRVSQESVVAGYVNLALAPVNNSRHLLLIGGGAGIQYKAYSQFRAFNFSRYSVESIRRTQVGFNALMGYDYKLNSRISLGLRQNFIIDGDVIPLLTIGAGVRF